MQVTYWLKNVFFRSDRCKQPFQIFWGLPQSFGERQVELIFAHFGRAVAVVAAAFVVVVVVPLIAKRPKKSELNGASQPQTPPNLSDMAAIICSNREQSSALKFETSNFKASIMNQVRRSFDECKTNLFARRCLYFSFSSKSLWWCALIHSLELLAH